MKVVLVTDIPVLVLVMLVFIRFEVIMIQLEVLVVDMLGVDMMLVGIIVDEIIVVESVVLVVLKIVLALLGLVSLVVENMTGIMLLFFREVVIVIRLSGEVLMLVVLVSILVVSMDIVDCSVLYKVVIVVKYGEEYLIEDISGLDCFSDIIIGVWWNVVFIDGGYIEDVIDNIELVALVNIFTGTSDMISGVVLDVVIIAATSNVVFAVDMLYT